MEVLTLSRAPKKPSGKYKRPNAKMKMSRKGEVTFESQVDHAQYKLFQLAKQALYDSGKALRSKTIYNLLKRDSVSYKNKGLRWRIRKAKNPSVKYEIKRWEDGLKIGLTHDTWYSARQELGDKGQPKKGILRNTVMENIDLIREIQSQYLTGMNDHEEFEAEENPDMEVVDD